jgi:hypothetical protein
LTCGKVVTTCLEGMLCLQRFASFALREK